MSRIQKRAWEPGVKEYSSSASAKLGGTLPVVYTSSSHHALQSFKSAIVGQ